jgi:cellulose synthase/poly-beta-1,6-N-acetylglucosamine synthase-like glycosyltransferase
MLFCIPFILAFLSWYFFPIFVDWLLTNIIKLNVPTDPASLLWNWLTTFFYSWYTLLIIGFAGVWIIAAKLARNKKINRNSEKFYPLVSFVIPAYNEEKNISKCVKSLFKCAEAYHGPCEILIIDDGSTDFTYEVVWATIQHNQRINPRVRSKIIRHSRNLGKIEAIKSGVNRALGSYIAVVDADSWWLPNTLVKLVDYIIANGKKAVTGYVNPSNNMSKTNPYVALQKLEYSQGLGVVRCAQSLGNNVLVVCGAIGLYDADILREILNCKSVSSVTEDLEITLEMHKMGAKVGYVNGAISETIVPTSFHNLWHQRLRWFKGWLHNTLTIHKDLLLKKTWLTLLLWYCYIFEYCGAFIDIVALTAFPLLFWFAPDRFYFLLNLLIFIPYGLLIGIINQALALKYAHNNEIPQKKYRFLLFYTPIYPILRLLNIFARITSSFKYFFGDHGNWHNIKK